MKKKSGLGKGLGALISAQEEEAQEKVPAEQESGVPKMVDIYSVEPDRDQPRRVFDEGGLEELSNSIRQYGVLQPILVNKQDGYYKIIAGERRWRAAKMAGVEQVPIIVKELTETNAFEVSLIENIQRQDLSPIEEAQAYQRLMEEFHLTQEEISVRVGKSRSAIANFLRLLRLNPEVQRLIQEGIISQGHAKVLLGIADTDQQYELALRVMDEDLSVRQLERLLQQMQKEKKPKTKKEEEPFYRSLEEQMQDMFKTKVNIVNGKKKGKIEIEYYSEEDLDRLMTLFYSMREK